MRDYTQHYVPCKETKSLSENFRFVFLVFILSPESLLFHSSFRPFFSREHLFGIRVKMGTE